MVPKRRFWKAQQTNFRESNKANRMRFWTNFHSVVAQKEYSKTWKVLQKRTHKALCSRPKSSFVEHRIRIILGTSCRRVVLYLLARKLQDASSHIDRVDSSVDVRYLFCISENHKMHIAHRPSVESVSISSLYLLARKSQDAYRTSSHEGSEQKIAQFRSHLS